MMILKAVGILFIGFLVINRIFYYWDNGRW